MRFLLLILLSMPIIPFAQAETIALKAKTPRGEEVEVLVAYPEGSEGKKLPAVVAAVGRNYHMGLPIFTELRAQGAAAGMIVYTFNWNFFTKGTKPQEDLKNEAEDMQSVLDLAKSDPRVDASKIIIEGKSLGTVAAYRVFQANADAFALHLWTPLCETEADLNEFYPGLIANKRPVVLVSGTGDEACNPKVMHTALANAENGISYVMVPGDHGFLVGDLNDRAMKERNDRNIAAVIGIAVQWMRAALGI